MTEEELEENLQIAFAHWRPRKGFEGELWRKIHYRHNNILLPLASAACFLLALGAWLAPQFYNPAVIPTSSSNSSVTQGEKSQAPTAPTELAKIPQGGNSVAASTPYSPIDSPSSAKSNLDKPGKELSTLSRARSIQAVIMGTGILLGVLSGVLWFARRRRWSGFDNVNI